jgi:hypothetical protein
MSLGTGARMHSGLCPRSRRTTSSRGISSRVARGYVEYAFTVHRVTRDRLRHSAPRANKNERTHQLQQQIRKAGSGSTRGRRDEELSAQSIRRSNVLQY